MANKWFEYSSVVMVCKRDLRAYRLNHYYHICVPAVSILVERAQNM
jgi:hypothetical protein